MFYHDGRHPLIYMFASLTDLPRWNKVGRLYEVLLRIRVMNATESDRLCFRLNGVEFKDNLLRQINEMYRMQAPCYRTGSGYWFILRLDQIHWPKNG